MTSARTAGFRESSPRLTGGVLRSWRPTELDDGKGKFITTSSVYLAVTLNVPEVPREGAQIRANSALSSPGGGYIVAAGVRALGVETLLASPLGTGPNSHSIRRSLRADGIDTFTTAMVGDIGVGVTMVDDDGKAATVVAAGVEAEPNRETLEAIDLYEGDLVHISGADLVSPKSSSVLVDWGKNLPIGVTLVISISPAVNMVPAPVWMPLLKRADVVSLNIREAATLTDVLNDNIPGTGVRHVMREDAGLVRRTGPMGCEVQTSLSERRVEIPAFATQLIDTTGVGDTHVAVMCASLLQGYSLLEACRRANAGAAIELSHPTSFPLPTLEQIDEVMALGYVPSSMRIQNSAGTEASKEDTKGA